MAIRVMVGGSGSVKILAGLPSYDGQRWNGSAISALHRSGVDTFEESRSLLANVFNRCWVEALNRRKSAFPVTHFLMLHADIIPIATDWFEQLWREFNDNKCKVLSVAVPIKTEAGLTSTALESGNLWRPRRLTVTEILDRPVTWTAPDLLVNTGLMLVDLREWRDWRDEPWVEKICFTINDEIHEENGTWVAEVEPEDWNFSRQCRALGVPLHVTRRVGVAHVGNKAFHNDVKWGVRTDPRAWTGE